MRHFDFLISILINFQLIDKLKGIIISKANNQEISFIISRSTCQKLTEHPPVLCGAPVKNHCPRVTPSIEILSLNSSELESNDMSLLISYINNVIFETDLCIIYRVQSLLLNYNYVIYNTVISIYLRRLLILICTIEF